MNYDDFLKETEQIEKLSAEEQKTYYGHLLEVSQEKTKVRLHASFCLGQLFYQDGDFRKAIEIMEPIVVDYQSYPYIPKMLSCFNLMGVATHCEAEYGVSRLLYETALKIAEEHDARFYYAFEYNNIALTYIAEQNYEEALKNLELAEAVLKDCDEEMGAYIYTNKSISLQKLNRLPEAEQAYYKDIAIIKQDKRLRVQPVGVLFADVNGLKRVNDEFGHDAGDELIIHVAKRIATAFPEAKKYRFGGDEFVIFSFDQNETEFQGKLECFVQSWDDEYSASVGSVWLHHAKDCEKGIAIADERMYQDKRRYYKWKQ